MGRVLRLGKSQLHRECPTCICVPPKKARGEKCERCGELPIKHCHVHASPCCHVACGDDEAFGSRAKTKYTLNDARVMVWTREERRDLDRGR